MTPPSVLATLSATPAEPSRPSPVPDHFLVGSVVHASGAAALRYLAKFSVVPDSPVRKNTLIAVAGSVVPALTLAIEGSFQVLTLPVKMLAITENFAKYLKAAAPDAWTTEPSKKWSGTGEGRDGSAGVADSVAKTDGGITYVELSFAKDNKLSYAQVDNGSGPVELTGESAGKAVAAATVTGTGNDLKLKLDYATKAPGAYPIVLVTYEVVCSKNKDAAKGTAIKAFLKHFSSSEVQTALADIGYAPLPAEIASKVTAAVDALS